MKQIKKNQENQKEKNGLYKDIQYEEISYNINEINESSLYSERTQKYNSKHKINSQRLKPKIITKSKVFIFLFNFKKFLV